MKYHPDETPNLFCSNAGLGLGFRPDHYKEISEGRAKVKWFEAISENHMGDGGRSIRRIETLRKDYSLALHGVSMNIGSTDPLNLVHLRKLKRLADRVEPMIVSDHCCWTGVNGKNLHDLLPLPFTEEVARHVASRVSYVQEFLGRQILLENVSSYLTFSHSDMTEWEFLSEISRRADCGILLDVNNIYVSAVNHGFDARDYLNGIPVERVGQMHLAGHSIQETPHGKFLIDTHDHPVCDEVWELYAHAVSRFGAVNTMVEWDDNIPSFDRLQEEILKAGKIQEKILGKEKKRPSLAQRTPKLGSADHHKPGARA